jgi:geranylgeranyl diphosphate synthase type I
MTALRDRVPLRHHRARIAQYLRGVAFRDGSVAARIIAERLPGDSAGDPLRPGLVLWACAARSGDVDDALPVAAAFYLFDRFLVLHAELGSDTSSSVAKWGLGQSLNAGDALYALAFRTLASDVRNPQRRLETARVVGESVLEAIEGNHAALTRAALEAGAFLAGAAEPVVRAFARAGDLLSKEPAAAAAALQPHVSGDDATAFKEVARYIAQQTA